jgi:hypothetical protein
MVTRQAADTNALPKTFTCGMRRFTRKRLLSAKLHDLLFVPNLENYGYIFGTSRQDSSEDSGTPTTVRVGQTVSPADSMKTRRAKRPVPAEQPVL